MTLVESLALCAGILPLQTYRMYCPHSFNLPAFTPLCWSFLQLPVSLDILQLRIPLTSEKQNEIHFPSGPFMPIVPGPDYTIFLIVTSLLFTCLSTRYIIMLSGTHSLPELLPFLLPPTPAVGDLLPFRMLVCPPMACSWLK